MKKRTKSEGLTQSTKHHQSMSSLQPTKAVKQKKLLTKHVIERNSEQNRKRQMNKQNTNNHNGLNKSDKTTKIQNKSRLSLSTTVNIVINDYNSENKSELLDSLLYGDVDLTYSQDFTHKQQDNDELLLENYEPLVHFKNCKNLSPIKSISEYSVTQNEEQGLIVQKIVTKSSNAVLKVRNKQKQIQQKRLYGNVLLRRVLIFLQKRPEGLLNFYYSIYQVLTKQDLCFKIRQFLFQNAIIFNKSELNDLVDMLDSILYGINQYTQKYEYCQQNLQIMMEKVFITVGTSNSEIVENIWLQQEIYERVFEKKQICSIWKLILALNGEGPKQIQASFRQSRFCQSMDSSLFIHQTDQKKKEQTNGVIVKWVSNFIRQLSQLNEQSINVDFIQVKINSQWRV